MGLFSDEDINDAEKLLKDSKDKEFRNRFLSGFEVGWKSTKNGEDFGGLSRNRCITILEQGVNADPFNFGKVFGFLVAMFRFHPRKVIQPFGPVDAYKDYINSLKNNEHYYKLIATRLQRWKKQMKTIENQLTTQEKDMYVYFLKSV